MSERAKSIGAKTFSKSMNRYDTKKKGDPRVSLFLWFLKKFFFEIGEGIRTTRFRQHQKSKEDFLITQR